MSDDHVVSHGEHLTRIAAFHGFKSYAPLWNDPANAAVRSKRHNPNILAVGDTVHVPKLELREVDRPTEKRHRFRAELHPLELRLAFQNFNRKPSPEATTEVLLDGKPAPFEAPGPGQTAIPVGPMSDRCLLRIGGTEIVVRIGFLEPVATVPGFRARLNNLGYDAGGKDDPEDAQLRSAVEEFQCDYGLQVDGRCGPATQARLAAEHGC